jgi:hypothetical protein
MRCSYYYWLGLEVQSGNGGAGQFCMFSSESVRRFDTVEVWGSSPHGPTISFNKLAKITEKLHL